MIDRQLEPPAAGGLDAAHLGPVGLERGHRRALRPTEPIRRYIQYDPQPPV